MRTKDETKHTKCKDVLDALSIDYLSVERNCFDCNPDEFVVDNEYKYLDPLILTKEELIILGNQLIDLANSPVPDGFKAECEEMGGWD